MRFILSIAIILLANTLPALAQNSQSGQFVGTVEGVKLASEHADDKRLEIFLRRNKLFKNVHRYLFHSNNQWFLFDSKGDGLVYKLLINKKGSTKQSFMVKGRLKGDVISVERICDISVQQF